MRIMLNCGIWVGLITHRTNSQPLMRRGNRSSRSLVASVAPTGRFGTRLAKPGFHYAAAEDSGKTSQTPPSRIFLSAIKRASRSDRSVFLWAYTRPSSVAFSAPMACRRAAVSTRAVRTIHAGRVVDTLLLTATSLCGVMSSRRCSYRRATSVSTGLSWRGTSGGPFCAASRFITRTATGLTTGLKTWNFSLAVIRRVPLIPTARLALASRPERST